MTSGKGTLASPTTYALTNTTVTGTVKALPGGAGQFTIKTAVGATLADAYGGAVNAYFTAVAGDAMTEDGVAETVVADWDDNLSVGDAITYARAGNKQTIAYTNAAPAAVSGTALANLQSSSMF